MMGEGDKSRTKSQRITDTIRANGWDMAAVDTPSLELDAGYIERTKRSLEVRKKAFEILESGEVIKQMVAAYAECHVGDTEILKVCLCGMASQQDLASQGIQPTVNGEAGVGKSSAFRAFMHLMPEDYKFEGSASDKAFFYFMNRAGMIVFLDDVVLSKELLATIKRAKSNFQKPTRHATVIEKVGTVQEIPARTMFISTSVQTAGDEQSMDRDFNISISNDTAHYELFDNWIRDKAAKGEADLPDTENVLIARQISNEIKSHLFKVIIDFAPYLKMKSEIHGKRSTKDFWDFIRAVAILNFMKREKVSEAENVITIRATIDDLEEARAIFDCNKELKKLGLSKDELKILNAIRRFGPCEMEFTKLLAATKLSEGTLRRRLYGEHTESSNVMGLLDKVPGLERVSVTDFEGEVEGQGGYERNVVKRGRQSVLIRSTLSPTDPLGSYTNFYEFDEAGWKADPNFRPIIRQKRLDVGGN